MNFTDKPQKMTVSRAKLDEITRIAARDLAKKMSLEPKLISKLRKLFNKISRDAKDYYVLNNTLICLSPYKAELTKMLFEHYIRVYKSFSNVQPIVKKSYNRNVEVKKDNPDGSKPIDFTVTNNEIKTEKEIQDSLERADKQSYYIMNTTQKQLSESYFEAESESPITGTTKSSEDVAKTATEYFNEKSKSRPESISATETQAVAEKAKANNTVQYTIYPSSSGAIETLPGESFNPLEDLEEEDRETLSGYTVKYWVTMADNRVREAHIEAEGQVVFADEPFIVMGEELMEPGDTSLGASDANIINCRCTAVYETFE